MSQSNQAAWGYMDEPVRAYKAPPSTTITEHWNYEDRKDFHGGYFWMAQGPLPIETMTIITGSKGLSGAALHEEMLRCNHLVGLKMVGEQLPNENNRVTLADDTDQYGLPSLVNPFGGTRSFRSTERREEYHCLVIAGGNWWRANKIVVIRHSIGQTRTRHVPVTALHLLKATHPSRAMPAEIG
jgi:hypothetical protein